MGEEKVKIIPIIVEGFEINAPNVTFQKLQEFSLTLFEKLKNHRKERNFLLLERDKLRTVLENTRHEIKIERDTTLNKEEEFEKAEERHAKEKKEVDQEVKYILYSHGLNLGDLKQWENRVMAKQEQMNLEEEMELLQEKRSWKERFRAGKLKCQEELDSLKKHHLEELRNLQKECDQAQYDSEVEFRRNFLDTIEHQTLKHRMEMSEVEERKNSHLAELKTINNSRTDKMKKFFNSVTAENLAIILNLKQSLDSLKANKTTMIAEVKMLRQENEKLKEPLEKSKHKVELLKRQLVNYEKDLLSLKNNKRMLNNTIDKTKNIKHESDKALDKLNGCGNKGFIEELDTTCLYSITKFKNDSETKRNNLEEIIDSQIEDLNKKQNLIQQLSSDPDVAEALKELNFEYWSPKQLSYELAVICKAYDELLVCFEEKLQEFCVSETSLGFKPMNMEYCTSGSASLVSKN